MRKRYKIKAGHDTDVDIKLGKADTIRIDTAGLVTRILINGEILDERGTEGFIEEPIPGEEYEDDGRGVTDGDPIPPEPGQDDGRVITDGYPIPPVPGQDDIEKGGEHPEPVDDEQHGNEPEKKEEEKPRKKGFRTGCLIPIILAASLLLPFCNFPGRIPVPHPDDPEPEPIKPQDEVTWVAPAREVVKIVEEEIPCVINKIIAPAVMTSPLSQQAGQEELVAGMYDPTKHAEREESALKRSQESFELIEEFNQLIDNMPGDREGQLEALQRMAEIMETLRPIVEEQKENAEEFVKQFTDAAQNSSDVGRDRTEDVERVNGEILVALKNLIGNIDVNSSAIQQAETLLSQEESRISAITDEGAAYRLTLETIRNALEGKKVEIVSYLEGDEVLFRGPDGKLDIGTVEREVRPPIAPSTNSNEER